MSEKEIQKVAAIFQNLGAAKEKENHGKSLIKRAEQLANKMIPPNYPNYKSCWKLLFVSSREFKPDKKALSKCYKLKNRWQKCLTNPQKKRAKSLLNE